VLRICKDHCDGLSDHLLACTPAPRSTPTGPTLDEKDVEIVAARHQLAVLGRHVARPRYSPTDRAVLAMLAPLLCRERRAAFVIAVFAIAATWAWPSPDASTAGSQV
jgi:hypothetical protein